MIPHLEQDNGTVRQRMSLFKFSYWAKRISKNGSSDVWCLRTIGPEKCIGFNCRVAKTSVRNEDRILDNLADPWKRYVVFGCMSLITVASPFRFLQFSSVWHTECMGVIQFRVLTILYSFNFWFSWGKLKIYFFPSESIFRYNLSLRGISEKLKWRKTQLQSSQNLDMNPTCVLTDNTP